MSVSSTTAQPHRFGSFKVGAAQEGCSERTFSTWAGKGFFPVYKRPGVRGYLVDLDEVARLMKRVPTKQARPNYGKLGPNARIIQLPAQPVIVNDGLDR
jgi:hypothetical protein